MDPFQVMVNAAPPVAFPTAMQNPLFGQDTSFKNSRPTSGVERAFHSVPFQRITRLPDPTAIQFVDDVHETPLNCPFFSFSPAPSVFHSLPSQRSASSLLPTPG